MSFRAPVHFVGISGIGMSALARVLHARGVAVSGSSDRRTGLTDRLRVEGIRVDIGHSAENLRAAQTVIVSSAIAHDNPELAAARAGGIALMRRGSLLASLMTRCRGIAVAGTHGKTTTTAMLGAMLDEGGWDPTVVVGGELLDGTNARSGGGQWLVAESDESDGSFLEMQPEVAVVTNIENDHVTSDAEFEGLVIAFASFLTNLGPDAVAVVGVDEPRGAMLAALARTARTVRFGFAAGADVCATSVRYEGFGSQFTVTNGGSVLGRVAIGVPGAMNVANALGAVAVALQIGVPFGTITAALGAFRGVHRRFEILARSPRMTVVDDYAHHPTAVEATVAAARAAWDGEIVVAFQPHRYSRTKYLAREFALALRGADRVVLTGVYPASEAPIPGVDATVIGEPLRAVGVDVAYVPDVADLPAYMIGHAPYGALVLALGAGTITDAAHRLAGLVEPRAAGARTP